MKIPAASRRQAAQQRREVFQMAGDQVAHFAFALPGAVDRKQP